MALAWKVTKETKGGKYWQADYDAYETPAGPARATAHVEPSAYFAGRESTYETWVHDPYLGQLGCRDYARFAYGSKIGGDHEEEAKAVCEGYGYRQATAGLDNFDIAKLYEDAFPAMAMRYLEDAGMVVEETVPVGRARMQARVLEGGYEPARVELWLGDDMTVQMGYK